MIEGLTLLPVVQGYKERTRLEDPAAADQYLDCNHCRGSMSEAARASWHCGWMKKARWTGHGFPIAAPIRPTVCPGYTTSLPKVIETARAFTWFEKGMLSLRYENRTIPHVAMDCIEVLAASIARVQGDMMREVKRKASRGN